MKTSELIKILVDSLVKNGDIPTNIDDYGWYSRAEGGDAEKIILMEVTDDERY